MMTMPEWSAQPDETDEITRAWFDEDEDIRDEDDLDDEEVDHDFFDDLDDEDLENDEEDDL